MPRGLNTLDKPKRVYKQKLDAIDNNDKWSSTRFEYHSAKGFQNKTQKARKLKSLPWMQWDKYGTSTSDETWLLVPHL